MFKNIGKKISGIARLLCILGIICSVLGGVIFGLSYITVNQPIEEEITLPDGTVIPPSNGTVEHTPSSPVPHIIGGILIALGGSVASWVSSFVMYGFGHLITKTSENNELIKKLAAKNAA